MVADFPPGPVAGGAGGLNVTLMVQLPPTGTGALQVLVCANCAGFAPLKIMVPTVSGPTPVFVRVTGWEALIVPLVCGPKVSDAGDREPDGL